MANKKDNNGITIEELHKRLELATKIEKGKADTGNTSNKVTEAAKTVAKLGELGVRSIYEHLR